MDSAVRSMVLRFTVGENAPLDLDLYQLTLDESIALQTLTELTFKQLTEAVTAGDAGALKVFYWTARVKSGDKIPYDDPSVSPRWCDFRCEVNPQS